MWRKVLSIFLFVLFLSFSSNVYGQTRTDWEQNNGEEIVDWNNGNNNGNEGDYQHATIPDEADEGWVAYDGPENINYSEVPSSLCPDEYECQSAGQFTYFRTHLDIPDIDVDEFKVSAEVVVDGIRITIFNSVYPDGEHIAYIDTPGGITEDLKEKVVTGEINTLVITHLDNCCCSNSFLNGVQIIVNENVVFACSPPVVITRDVEVLLDYSGQASISAATVDAGSWSDCGIDVMSVAPNTFDCNHLGENIVTLTVKDVKGNTATGQAVVTVKDDIKPTVSNCPSNIPVNNEPGACGAVVSWIPPSFTDNCTIVSVTSSHNPGHFFQAECAGSAQGTMVTYTAVDDCGNTTTCSFTVTVMDNEAPVVSNCPEDITVNNDPGSCGAVVSWTPPTFIDNCNVASITSTHNPGDFFSPAECAGSAVGTVVTYTAVDDCGNTTTCSFTVTVMDNEAPVVSNCPEDITVNNDPGLCGAVVSWTPPSFTDNCNVASITSTHNPGDFFSPAECEDSAVGTVVTYTAVDDCGNTTICSFTVTVLDKESPVISITGVAGNTEGLKLEGDYGYWGPDAAVFWNTENIVVSYDVTDNCDESPAIDFKVEWEGEEKDVGVLNTDERTITIDPYLLVGQLKVTVTATDYCGNSASDATEFSIILYIPEGKMIVKPERFCINPGRFTNFLWFPDPYDVTTITEARSDGAPLEKMNTCAWCLDEICDQCEEYLHEDYAGEDEECDEDDDECIDSKCHDNYDLCDNLSVKANLKFRRNEIPPSLVDTSFVLRGVFIYNDKEVYFQGYDEVKRDCQKAEKPSQSPKFGNPYIPAPSFYSTPIGTSASLFKSYSIPNIPYFTPSTLNLGNMGNIGNIYLGNFYNNGNSFLNFGQTQKLQKYYQPLTHLLGLYF